jgi:hypothetical protein
MPILRETALSALVLVAFLYASHALVGPEESEPVKHLAVKHSVTNAGSWLGADAAPAERWLIKDSITTGQRWTGTEPPPSERSFARYASPAARVSQVFAQFVPGERRREI